MKKTWLLAGVAIFFLTMAPGMRAQDFSFSTDFDGVGSGAGFTLHFEHPTFSHPSGERQESRGSSDGGEFRRSSRGSMESYLAERYQEQLREAQRRAEEERLREAAEQARRRQNVTRLESLLQELEQMENDEPSRLKQMEYVEQVLELDKQFERARQEYMATLPSYRRRLGWSLDHIVVPPPRHPLHYRQILIEGTTDTPAEARKQAESGLPDPFEGTPYDDVFAFGTSGVGDFGRSALDHLLSTFQTLSPETKRQLGALKGATADEVVCHSNGCVVAEVMIATGLLKVKKLRMLGGDTALFELSYLKKLQRERHLEEISVYVIQGDRVPLLDPGWKIMDLMRKIGHPLKSFGNRMPDSLDQYLGLTPRPGYQPDAPIQVHTLSYPAVSDWHLIQKHLYENYARVIRGWRMSGCLSPAGATNRRCMIY